MFIKFLSELPPCESCITLRQQLEHERYQNQQLLNTILEMANPKRVVETEDDSVSPIPLPNTRFQNFAEKRKQLESQSRIEAQKLEQLKRDTSSSDKVEGIQELEDMIGLR